MLDNLKLLTGLRLDRVAIQNPSWVACIAFLVHPCFLKNTDL